MITSGIPVLCLKCNGKSFIICSYFCLTTLTLYLGLYLTLRVWHILVVSKRICCSSTSILCTYVNVQLIYKDIKKNPNHLTILYISSKRNEARWQSESHWRSVHCTTPFYQDGLKALWCCGVLENTLGCSVIGVPIQSSRQYTLDKGIN